MSRQILRLTLSLTLMLWSIVLIGWLILHWGILPHIDDWRPEIEKRASVALGLPVRIGHITVQSPGWVPALELREVVLADREGREALRLPLVQAALSPKTLYRFKLLFSQLYIEGAELEVRRDAQGRLHVAGLDMDTSARLDEKEGDEGDALDWLFDQPEFVLRHGTLRWLDQQRQAPPLALHDADVVLRNGLRRHDLRLDATPEAGWGERFTLMGRFTQPLLARNGDWARWSGTLYAHLPRADVARLRDHVTLPFDLNAGAGAARVWLDLSKGQWRRATLDAALDAVELRLAKSLEPLALEHLQGRIEAERSASNLRVSAQNFGFSMGDGSAWPASRFSLALQQHQTLALATLSAAPVAGGEFNADRLDLGLMAAIASRLPLPDNIRHGLAELAPTGVVQGLQGNWAGPPEQPSHYRIKGKIGGLSIAALPAPDPTHVGRPGWRGADLEIEASEVGGEAKLAVTDGALELPGVFEDPLLPVERFTSRLVWQIEQATAAAAPAASAGGPALPTIDLRVLDAQFANADARGDLQLHWHTGSGSGHGKGGRYPGVIDVTAHIDQGQAERVERYLPRGLEHTRAYVAGAVQGGLVRNAKLRLRGDLHEFPFAQSRDGEFNVSAHAENLTFSYVPPVLSGGIARWPEFTEVSGELVFDRTAMHIKDAKAKLWGIELKGVNGHIANLVHEPVLVIEGGGRGPLTDGLRYVSASPVGGWLSNALKDTTGSGLFDLKLALTIPLHDSKSTTVKGSVALAGNDVRLRPDVPALFGARSRVDFTERSFVIAPGSAKALGGEMTFDGGLGNDGVVRFAAQGNASAEGLRQASELGLVPRLATSMSGQAAYKVQVAARRGQTELLITSPLTGMAIDLPQPFKKTAEASWPLRIQTQALPAAGEGSLRDQLHIELDGVLQADYQRELAAEGTRVLRGSLVLAEGGTLPAMPTMPNAGVAALLQLPHQTLNADAWSAVLAGGKPAEAKLPDARSGERAAERMAEQAAGYLPTDAMLRSAGVTLAGRRFAGLSANLQRRGSGDSELWRVQLQGDAVQGQLEYRPAGAGAPWPRWQARFARLSVPAAEASAGGAAPAVDPASESLNTAAAPPALDLVVDDLDWRGRKLGKFELDGRPAEGGGPRDWRLNKLALSSPEAHLAGTGQWAAAKRRMALELKLDVADGGTMLEHLGFGKQLRNGKGLAQGQFAWTGSPLWPDWGSLSGNAKLNLDSGQFLKAEPGAARFLSVLSLQSLPRRLTLDFRDVFQQGFAFDNLSGDIQLDNGVAHSNNLRIRGVQAAILIEGQADLKRETQDLHMVVVPEINAGTASLAYAAINPAIGLGTFLAQLFLRKPLMQAGTREFKVGGTWAEPQVEPIERHPDAPVPDLDAAAAASAPTLGR